MNYEYYKEMLSAHRAIHEAPKISEFLKQLSGADKDTLLGILLEVYSPIEAIDYRLSKIDTIQQRNAHQNPILDKYIEAIKCRLDDISIHWLNIQHNRGR